MNTSISAVACHVMFLVISENNYWMQLRPPDVRKNLPRNNLKQMLQQNACLLDGYIYPEARNSTTGLVGWKLNDCCDLLSLGLCFATLFERERDRTGYVVHCIVFTASVVWTELVKWTIGPELSTFNKIKPVATWKQTNGNYDYICRPHLSIIYIW